jgi:hypothetical protein
LFLDRSEGESVSYLETTKSPLCRSEVLIALAMMSKSLFCGMWRHVVRWKLAEAVEDCTASGDG